MESVNGDEMKENFSPSAASEEIKECLSRCPDCIINTVAPGRTLTYILCHCRCILLLVFECHSSRSVSLEAGNTSEIFSD